MEKRSETIDINEPRLVTGMSLLNLEPILQSGCLDPDGRGISYTGKKCTFPPGELFFNVIGIIPPQKFKPDPSTYQLDPNPALSKFGDEYYSKFECYLLINEDALLEEHRNLLKEAGINTTEGNIEEIRETTNQNFAQLVKFLGKEGELRDCQNANMGNFCLTNPNKGDAGKAVEGVSIDLIAAIKRLRANIADRTERLTCTRDASNNMGVFTTHSIPIEAIEAIVLSPLEKMKKSGGGWVGVNPSGIQNLQEALDLIDSLYKKYDIRIPVYDYENHRLL